MAVQFIFDGTSLGSVHDVRPIPTWSISFSATMSSANIPSAVGASSG